MRKILIALLLTAIVLTWPVSASAQSAIGIDQLGVKLWPEYDEASMLVIYSLILPEELAYPLTIELPMPDTVDSPFVVASGPEPDTIRDTKDYTIEHRGNQNVLLFSATGPYIHYEYYDTSLAFNGAARTFDFEITFSYPIQNVTIEVQEPIDTQQIDFSMPLVGPQPKDDALNYYTGTVASNLAANTPIVLGVDYQKNSDTLSLGAIQASQSLELPLPVEAAQPVGSDSTFSFPDFFANANSWGVALIALGAMIMLGIVGYNMWENRQPKQRQRKRGGKKERPAYSSKSDVHCHNCGAVAYKDDKFCRDCGTKLRG